MLWERSEGNFRTHQAAASVLTGLAVTLPDLRVTVDPSEAGQAGAGEAALARVHARGSIGAGPVVGAIVQVCRGNTGGTFIYRYTDTHLQCFVV